MKKLDLSKYVPLGVNPKHEISIMRNSLLAAAVYALTFFIRYSDAYSQLFTMNHVGERVLIQGAVMPDFVEILGASLIGFPVVMVAAFVLAVAHYGSHFGKSRSIYVMKRVPSGLELHRRCLALPLAAIVLSAVCFALMLLILYFAYMTITPEACLTPGQWAKLW